MLSVTLYLSWECFAKTVSRKFDIVVKCQCEIKFFHLCYLFLFDLSLFVLFSDVESELSNYSSFEVNREVIRHNFEQ